ncbi:hypothetical protein D4764_02G0000780 [Takifugu flavidus]|uniref:Uncharacterized protein n=1 Tax=Takifugu flavidus TaxID=433684 RepID=A0A5C6NN06_9TELE|nr:hypothetical protein D4764_02G0000780 [Takifugu flavidus]
MEWSLCVWRGWGSQELDVFYKSYEELARLEADMRKRRMTLRRLPKPPGRRSGGSRSLQVAQEAPEASRMMLRRLPKPPG